MHFRQSKYASGCSNISVDLHWCLVFSMITVCFSGFCRAEMEHENYTVVTEFVLLGLSQNHEVQVILFFFFLLFYMIILPGNVLIIVTI